MKTLPLLAALLLLAGGCSAPGPAPEEDGPLRILLTCGGHGFQEKAFKAFWDGFEGMEVVRVDLPDGFSRLRPGLENEFDVIVRYDMIHGIPEEQCLAFAELIRGGTGLVALHHNLGAHRDWPAYADIIRGRFFIEPATIDGTLHPKSTWANNQDVPVSIAPGSHEVIRGMKDFRIHDETYGGVMVDREAQVLLTTDHPASTEQLLWVSRYGKGRVATLMLGHDNRAWTNVGFRKVLDRAIRWAAGRR